MLHPCIGIGVSSQKLTLCSLNLSTDRVNFGHITPRKALTVNPTSPLFRTLKKQRTNSLLSSASVLGLGVGFLGNSVAKADDLKTIIPPQFYQQADDGQVVQLGLT